MSLYPPIWLIESVSGVALLGVGATVFNAFTSKRVVVPTNMVHIVQTGRKTISYGKDRPAGNVYYNWSSHLPFIGVSVTELPESVFTVELNNYEAYDAGRLPFVVDIRAFFRIADSDTAAHRVSSHKDLTEQLTAILQGVVRRVLGTNTLEVIMGERAKLASEFTAEVEPQLPQWGIQTVKSIEFMDIRDHAGSQVIENIMQKEMSRINKESRIQVALNAQAAQEQEVASLQAVNVRKIESEQAQGQRKAEAEKQVGLSSEKSRQEVQEQAKLTAERDMAVKLVMEVRAAEISRQVAEVEAQQNQNVAVLEAEGERQKTQIIAAGQLEASKRNAEGTQALGLAKAEAEKALQMAPVAAKIALAQEIGANAGYQAYLVNQRKVEAVETIGIAQARSLEKADIKVIANGGTISSGMSSIADLFTSSGGLALGSMLEGLAETPAGKAVVDTLSNRKSKNGNGATL